MISFIIPTRDEEGSLEKLLRSLTRYTGEHEIIVSDGKSKDKTLEIARHYTNRVVEYKGIARQTIAMGRNDGAAAAHGGYLFFLDADDYIPDIDAFMDRVFKYFSKYKDLVGLSGFVKVNPEKATFGDDLVTFAINYYYYVMNRLFGVAMVYGEFMIVKSEAFIRVNGFNPLVVASEDFELFRRLRKVGRVRFSRRLVVYHSGRRAHKIGWPKLLAQWFINWITVLIFGAAASKEWKEIR